MSDAKNPGEPTDRLDGWGSIAGFLKYDIRTVQRWERTEGLPVHRHPGAKARVWASRRELEAWWAERENSSTPSTAADEKLPETGFRSQDSQSRPPVSGRLFSAILRPWSSAKAATAVVLGILVII